MSLKVLLVVLNIITLGANTEGISENEFVLVSTSESPEEENINKISETISKIEETNRHLLAVLTQMVDAGKSEKKKQDSVDNTIQKKLQLIEKSNEEQQQSLSRLEQNLEVKKTVDQLQKKLDEQEKTIQEHERSLSRIENSLKEKLEKNSELQQELDQQNKTIEKLQKILPRIEQNLEEKSRKVSDMQKMLDQHEKTMEKQQKSLSRMESNLKLENEKSVELEAVYTKVEQVFPRNCKEIQKYRKRLSGVYTIRPKREYFNVWCDMDKNDGGWTLVQNRFDGSENFNRNWTDYEEGFGNLTGEFWLGLRHLHELTSIVALFSWYYCYFCFTPGDHTNELLIELVDKNDKKAYASYDRFSVDSEARLYAIKSLRGYEGTAGNSFGAHHLGAKFSTWDRDNTLLCPEIYKSGWWFNDHPCLYCNLNGNYSHDGTISQNAQGINWYHFSSDKYSLLKSKMMVRPR